MSKAPEERFRRVWDAFAKAPVLDQRTLPPAADGGFVTQRVIRWHGKYPLLRIEEDHARGGNGPQERRVMVADHLMVKLRDGFTEPQLMEWARQAGLSVLRHLPGSSTYLVALPSGSLAGFDAVMQKLNATTQAFEYAEPDPLRFAASVPNDPSFVMQWALHNAGQTGGVPGADVDAPDAWDTTQGDASIVVAVIDSGMDFTHPDLVKNLWVNPGEIAGNYRDDDGDGYIDDVNGWNFYEGNNNVGDGNGHGTHCAGILGASANNATGIAGLAPLVKIMPLRVMDNDGVIIGSDNIEALNYATAKHVLLTSNSYCGASYNKTEKAAIDAAQAAGVLCICAAGNGFPAVNIDRAPMYPASYTSANIISVAASTDGDLRADFSNYGATGVDLAAPGVGILSTLPGGTYGYDSGTSMACPLVAGACVLVKAAHPALAWADIKTAILNGVDPVPGFKGLVKTGGRLNVARAVRIGALPCIEVTNTTVKDAKALGANGNGDGIINAGEDVTIAATIKNSGPLAAAAVTTTVSVRQAFNAVSVLRGAHTWGRVAVAASLTNNTAAALPFVIHIAPDAVSQSFTLVYAHADNAGHTWTSKAALSIAGTQTLGGKVTFVTGGKPVKGAKVSYTGTVSGSVLTAADGSYGAKVPDGNYTVTAQLAGYEPGAPQVIAVPPAATAVNFALGRSILAVTPASIVVNQTEQEVTTRLLTITNQGDLPLTVSVDNNSLGNAISPAYYNLSPYRAAIAGASANAAYAPLPWQDGFESGTSSLTPSRFHDEYDAEVYPYIYHYVIDYYVGSSSVVTDTAAVGQRCLYYRDPQWAGFDNGMERRFANGTQPRYVSYWVRPGSSTGTSGCFSLEDGSYDSTAKMWTWYPIVQVSADEGGHLDANGMLAGGDNSVPFIPKTWHHIELRNMDWSARTFDYWVNGTLIKSGIPFQGSSTQAIRAHIYNNTVEGESWWDEMRVLDQDVVWLSCTPVTLTVAPGTSSTVTVTASAAGQRPGTYTAELTLSSNDPIHPVFNVPVTMDVTPRPNSAPVAMSQTVTLDEDTLTAIPLLATDKENDSLTYVIKTLPKSGALKLTASGPAITSAPVTLPGAVVYYDPPVDGSGSRLASFTFQAQDYRLASNVATVTLNVTHVNHAPVAVDDYMTLPGGVSSTTSPVLANDTDRDGDPLKIISFTQGAKGTVSLGLLGGLKYTAGGGFNFGEDCFTYTIADPSGAVSTASVWVLRATSITATGNEDSDTPITLTGAAASGGGTVTRIRTLPAKGSLYQTADGTTAGTQITTVPTTLTSGSGAVLFRPAPDGWGAGYAQFTFDVADVASGIGAAATASVNVVLVPLAPRVSDDRFTVQAGVPTALNPMGNDVDPNKLAMTIISFTQPAHGTVTTGPQGGLTFLSDPHAGGTVETFTYTVSDAGGLSATGTVTLVIKGTSPDAWPTFGGDPDHRGYSSTTLGSAALTQQWATNVSSNAAQVAVAGGRVFATLPVYFADTAVVALDASTGAEIWHQAYPGAASINPPTWYGGSVFVQVQDGGTSQGAHLVSFNDATGGIQWASPFAEQWEHYFAPAVDETGVYVDGGEFGGMYKFDTLAGTQDFFFSGLDQYDQWAPTLQGGGLYSFISGVFHSHDLGTGTISWSKDFTWNWGGWSMNRTVACNGSSASFINNPASGNSQLINLNLTSKTPNWIMNGAFTGTPAVGSTTVFTISGGTVVETDLATGSTVRTYNAPGESSLNYQPIVTADAMVVASNTSTYIFNLGTTTPRQTLPFGGYVSVASHSLFIATTEGHVRRYGVANTTIPAPVALATTVTTIEDTPVTITLTGTGASPLHFVVDTLPSQGSLYQTADGVTKGAAIVKTSAFVSNTQGQLIYVPALYSSGNGIGSFTFYANDGNSSSADAAVTVNVTHVNHAPVALDDLVALRPGEGLAGFLPQLNDRDVDHDALSLVSFTQPAQGTVTIAANGGINFAPGAGFSSGSTSFQYTIQDPSGLTASATVTLTLTSPTGLNWPTFGAGPDHTGFQPVLLGSTALSETWATTLGSSVSQVAVANGRVFATLPVYFGNTAVVALDASTGAVLWQQPYIGASSINPPTWYGGSVFVQVQDGPSQGAHVVSFKDADGSIQWASAFYEQWEHYLAPAVDDTGVYVDGGEYGGLYGYDQNTGAQRFFQGLDQYDEWTPALYGGGLYSFIEGKFRSHDRSTGAVLWSQTFDWDWNGYSMNRTIACGGNAAFFINDTASQGYPQPRDLICMDLASHQVRWTVRNTTFMGTPAVGNGNVYAFADRATVNSYDIATGLLTGSYAAPTTSGLLSQPVVTDDTLIVADTSQTYLFDLQSGHLRQTLAVGGSLSLAGHSLYVSTSSGEVHCFQGVDPFDPPPVAVNATVGTDENTPVTITLSATGASLGPLMYVITQLPPGGKLYQVGSNDAAGTPISRFPAGLTDPQGRVMYVPPPDGYGAGLGSFAFKASDGNSLSAAGAITINVIHVNQPPVAVDDLVALRPGEGLTGFLPQLNDRDPDHGALSLISFTQPAQGTVTAAANGGVSFVPGAGFTSGSTAFQYTVQNPSGLMASATVTLTLTSSLGLNWPTFGAGPDHTAFQPVLLGSGALSETWATTVGSSVNQVAVANGRVFVTVPVYFANSAVIGLDAGSGGEVWRQSYTGAASMNPPSWYNGSVFVQVQDGPSQAAHLVSFNDATGGIQWASAFYEQWEHYLAPAVDGTGVYIDGGSGGGLYGYDKNTGAQRFFQSLPQYDGWTPALYNGGLYSFVAGVFSSHDRSTGAVLWSQTFAWNRNSYSMNRTVACGGNAAFFINDVVSQSYPVPMDLTCIDLTSKQVRWTVRNTSFIGTPAIAHGCVYALADSATVNSYDVATGLLIASYAAPVGAGLSTQPVVTDDTVIATDSAKTYLFDLQSGHLRQTLAVGGSVSLAGHSLYVATSHGVVHCFKQVDSSVSPPVALSATAISDENSSVTITLSATSSGPGPLGYLITQPPAVGQLHQVGTGNTAGALITNLPAFVSDSQGRVIYTPPLNGYGAAFDSFGFKASDGNSVSAAATVTINVNHINQPPVAVDDLVALRPGESLTGFLPQLNDRDPDHGVLTLVSFTQPGHGTVTAGSNGGVNFAPGSGFTSGSTSFQYTIQNFSGLTSSATVTLTLTSATGLNWSTFGVGSDHTGFQPVLLGATALSQAWAATVGNSASQVAVANGRVFVSVPVYFADSAVIALDAGTGKELWRHPYAAAASMNPPTWYNGSVFVQVQDGPSQGAHLVSFKDATGSVQWASAFYEQWEHYLAPAVDDTGVYVDGGEYGGLYGYDQNTGAQRFFQSLPQYDGWTPALYNGGLYSFVEGIFSSHDRTTGAVLWSQTFAWNWAGYTMNRTVACGGNAAFLINDTGLQNSFSSVEDLICIDLTSRQVRWTVRNTTFRGTPALAHGNVYALASATTVNSYDTATGLPTGSYAAAGSQGLWGQPIVTDDTVIATDGAQTYLFDLQSGNLRQTLPVGGSVSLANHSLYVAASGGVVHCYQAGNAGTLATAIAPAFKTSAAPRAVQGSAGSSSGLAAAGTAPAAFRIIACTLSSDGAAMQVSWPSLIGSSYRVQSSTDLKTWVDATASLSGTGTLMSQDIARPAGYACFLRVRIE